MKNDKIIQQSRLILTGKVKWRIFITVFYNGVMNIRFLLAGNYLQSDRPQKRAAGAEEEFDGKADRGSL